MDEKEKIPAQNKGASSDTVSSRKFDTASETDIFYAVVKKRLLDVNHWQEFAGEALAAFKLFDKNAQEVNRPVMEGDYFRIDIPGPGNPSGGGYDWVQVKSITEIAGKEKASATITVHPVTSPLNDDKDVAHFFSEEASSTFIARRTALEVFAEVHGRNEKPNIKGVDASDKVRNAVVAVGGILGFSKIQWKALTEGLVKPAP